MQAYTTNDILHYSWYTFVHLVPPYNHSSQSNHSPLSPPVCLTLTASHTNPSSVINHGYRLIARTTQKARPTRPDGMVMWCRGVSTTTNIRAASKNYYKTHYIQQYSGVIKLWPEALQGCAVRCTMKKSKTGKGIPILSLLISLCCANCILYYNGIKASVFEPYNVP